MGCIYKRADSKNWWIKYFDANGRGHCESTRTTKKDAARTLLKLREGAIARGEAVTPKVGRLKFEEAADN